MLTVLLNVFAWFISSCGHTLTLKTVPSAANVYFTDLNGIRQGLAGQTPLKLSQPKNGGKKYLLEIEKSGFKSHLLAVDQIHLLGSVTTISVNLSDEDEDQFKSALTGSFSNEASGLLNAFVELKTKIAQFKLNPTNAAAAQVVKRMEAKMKSQYDVFSSFNGLLGDFYFHAGDKSQSAKYLKRALELNPQDSESRRLLEQVSKQKK